MSLFRRGTTLASIYVPFGEEDVYPTKNDTPLMVTLHQRLKVYDNPSISLNDIIKTYFDESARDMPLTSTTEQYIRWLNTIYIIPKEMYIPPF